MASLLSTNIDGMENQEFLQLFSQYVPGPDEDWDIVSAVVDAAMDGMGVLPSELEPFPQPLPEPTPPPPPNGRGPGKNLLSGTKDQNEDDDEDDEDDEEDDGEDQAAAKRLRHREAMQRCRQRKRSRMGALEKQQKQLKALLRARLVEHQQREQLAAMRTSPPPPAPLAADSFGLLPMKSIEELRKLFARAVSLKEALMDERKDLEKSLRNHQKFERLVMLSTNQIVNEPKEPSGFHQPTQPLTNDTSDSMEDDASSGQDSSAAGSTTSSQPARPTGHWVEYLDNEDPLFYEPEPVEAIDEHIRECYQRVRRLKDSFDRNLLGISIKKTVCLGWTAEHAQLRLDDQRFELRFRFRRRVSVHQKSLDELQKATWNLMKDPVLNARLYSALVVCKVVQWVGENTFIFIRNAPDKDKRLHIRYFSMHSQMEYRTDNNERSYVTLMKILEKEPHILQSSEGKAPAIPVVWLKQGTLFLNFTEKPDTKEIEIEYGGSVHCMSDEQAQYLLIEIGGMLMRWEHMIIPQNLLTF